MENICLTRPLIEEVSVLDGMLHCQGLQEGSQLHGCS